MLAVRDQENLVHGHQTAAASKSLNQGTRNLQPKTPGNKYPKTPLKIPLHDENAPVGFGGGKSVLGTRGKRGENATIGSKEGDASNKYDFVTPMGPRNRAPLGMKTTNAKAKAFQTPSKDGADKDITKTQGKPTSARRPKPRITQSETIKLQVRGDSPDPLEEREIEYAPPKPKDLPYESDVFPDGTLNYDMLKGANLTKNWQRYYLNQRDENGQTADEKRLEERMARMMEEGHKQIHKSIFEEDWVVEDVPETFKANKEINQHQQQEPRISRAPGTVASRNAATALSSQAQSSSAKLKPTPTTSNSKAPISLFGRGKKSIAPLAAKLPLNNHGTAAAASRSTVGYTKGRSTSSALKVHSKGLPRSVSNISTGSDTTITPSRYAQQQGQPGGIESVRPKFLDAFDPDVDDDEDLEPGLRGLLPDCLREYDSEDDEFVMTLPD